MRKIYLSVLCVALCVITANAQLVINTQFINPCGGDEHNEFLVAKTAALPVNIADVCFGSYNPTGGGNLKDYNYWWRGNNTASSPYPVFSSVTGESCGDGLLCYGFRYPSVAEDKTDIDQLINQLNTIAGCNVFIPVPNTDLIPANSNVIIFVGAGYRGTSALCGFDNAAANLNFSNHCNGGTATTTYYAVFGNAAGANPNCANVGGGYFSNSSRRVSALHVLNAAGDSAVAADYTTSEQDYTPGANGATGNAGLIVPNGAGGTTWVNDKGCIPTPDQILAVKLEYFKGALQNKKVTLNWKSSFEDAIQLFIIEKSLNGTDFTPLENVEPANVSGSQYSTVDANIATGYNFYRLKTIHLNGTFEYSAVLRFNYNKSSNNLSVFPNPSSSVATVIYHSATAKNAVLMVTDIAGKLISKKAVNVNTGSNRLAIAAERLSSGMYIIQLVSNSQTDKVIFIKK